MKASEGAYVRYPFFDILGLLALESQRQGCVVIGEDLGTVPDQVRHALADADVLSYRVLLFERDGQGAFKGPGEYPEAAVAVASTHDLPTLAGWWEGRDLVVRAGHGLLAAATTAEALLAERGRDRALLLDALQREGLIGDGAPRDPRSATLLSAEVAVAVHRFLARTPAALAIVQAEDVLGVREQANLPGTIDQHPNWRQKLPLALDDTHAAREAIHAIAGGLRAERGRANG
jgi:4-alpha-glucanotransferase